MSSTQGSITACELRKGEPLRCIVDALTNGDVDFSILEECPLGQGFYDEVRFLSEQKKVDGGEAAPKSFKVPAGESRLD